jgi:hypothetical protein
MCLGQNLELEFISLASGVVSISSANDLLLPVREDVAVSVATRYPP